jgi:hypothetical protein
MENTVWIRRKSCGLVITSHPHTSNVIMKVQEVLRGSLGELQDALTLLFGPHLAWPHWGWVERPSKVRGVIASLPAPPSFSCTVGLRFSQNHSFLSITHEGNASALPGVSLHLCHKAHKFVTSGNLHIWKTMLRPVPNVAAPHFSFSMVCFYLFCLLSVSLIITARSTSAYLSDHQCLCSLLLSL